jgi:hypothetical protein
MLTNTSILLSFLILIFSLLNIDCINENVEVNKNENLTSVLNINNTSLNNSGSIETTTPIVLQPKPIGK